MTLIATNRFDPITAKDKPSLRFAELIENLVSEINDLTLKPITEIADNYTLLLDDAGKAVRYTGNSNITITIPAATFEAGTEIEIQNDSLRIVTILADDTLTSSAGLGLGPRQIASLGDARLFSTTTTNWKISGNQVT